jgi:hypothetical protein
MQMYLYLEFITWDKDSRLCDQSSIASYFTCNDLSLLFSSLKMCVVLLWSETPQAAKVKHLFSILQYYNMNSPSLTDTLLLSGSLCENYSSYDSRVERSCHLPSAGRNPMTHRQALQGVP